MNVTFVNGNGSSFSIDNNNYILSDWAGFGDMRPYVQSLKAPYQHGRTYIDTLAEPKEIILTMVIKASTRQTLFNRRYVVEEAFNPLLGEGYLQWTQPNGTSIFRIDCVPSEVIFPEGEAKSHIHHTVILRLTALKPFWYNPVQQSENMAYFIGGLELPFELPFTLGEMGNTKTVVNAGNVNTPVEIHFGGPITQPIVLSNETSDKDITITQNIAADETLKITTEFGNKTVIIDDGITETDAWQYVQADSKFWELLVGNNDLVYQAASVGEGALAAIYWYNRYSGR